MSLTEALVRVDTGASDEWKSACDEIIYDLARSLKRFSSDEIWYALDDKGIDTPEHRAMGPRIIAALKSGIIRIADCNVCNTVKVTITSTREVNHQSNIAVYESLIFEGSE